MRNLLTIVAAALVTLVVPHHLCAAQAAGFGADPVDDRLARGVTEWVDRGVGVGDFDTGHTLFDREWLFGTYQMAALGFGQHARDNPDARAADLVRMEACIDRLLDADARTFDSASWGEDPLASLDGPRGHIAYLGYLDLVLSLHRTLVPDSRYADLNDRITDALRRRLAADPTGIAETYPGERYPVDNAAAVGAIGLHARATGSDASTVAAFSAAVRARSLAPETGLLVQATRPDGTPADRPRGSGTFLAAYFLSFADPALSRDLYTAGRDAFYTNVGGFGAMREYPRGDDSPGDIDSGPLIAGYAVSSTGFALAGARQSGDTATYDALLATSELFGAPSDAGGVRHYAAGGPLGDAILFAMMTAR